MCLIKIFNTDITTGEPDCTYKTCQKNEESAYWVQAYANDEKLFKADFSQVFTKMLEHGYENTNTLYDIETNKIENNNQSYLREDDQKRVARSIMKEFENKPIKEQFKIFHLVYKKADSYSINSEEAIKRYKIFKSNLKNIKDIEEDLNEKLKLKNSNYINKDKGNNYKYGINDYTDLKG